VDSNGSNLGRTRQDTGGHDPSDLDDEERFGSPVDSHRIVRRLLAGKWWLIGALLIGALISLPLAKFGLGSSYKATAMLEYEGVPAIEGMPQPAEQNIGGMLQAIFIDSVLSQVKERMGLEMRTADVGLLISANADEAGVVRVDASADDPDEAARFANTVAEVFIEHRVQVQRDAIQDALDSLEQRMAAASASAQSAQQTYDAFRDEHGIADLSTEQEQAIENAAELRAQRDRAEAEVAALEARLDQLERDLRRTPRTRTSTSMSASPEAAELQRLESELAQARGSLSDSHPRVQALQQQIASLRERIASGEAQGTRTSNTTTNSQWQSLQSAVSTAQADLEGARQRLEGLTTQAERAQERVEQFSSIEGDASQLLAEVRVNQQLLTELQGTHARLEDAQRDPASGFRTMAPATAPEYAERSKLKYVVAGGIPMGLFLIVLLVLLGRELKGLKVRTAKELAFWGRGPVIGTSTWPRDAQAIDELIADMDDFIPDATGQMLVVGATEMHTELAVQFATRLNSDWYDTTLIGAPLFEDEPERLSLPPGDPMAGEDTIMSLPPHIAQQAAAIAMAQEHSLGPAGTGPAQAHHLDMHAPMQMTVEAWEGPDQGPAIRRAARLADRVCVLVPAGEIGFFDAQKIRTRLGRADGIGFILVGVDESYEALIDRVGPVERFWASTRD
jgi:uncharacterized protein involved in exopolysaccharide biosynthesis